MGTDDRPTLDEVEITEAMVEAGLRVFRGYRYDFDDESDAVRDIWVAMDEARRSIVWRDPVG